MRTEDEHVMKYGFHAALEGPRRWFGVGPAMEVSRLLELSLELGYRSASGDETSGTAHVSGSASVTTILGRARFWLFRHHSLIFDGGLGVAAYNVSMDGSDAFGNALTYRRSGSPLLATAGIGYGYRSDGSFRIAVLVGGMVHSGKLASSTLTTSGAFTAADANSLQASSDSTLDELTDPGAYVEVSFGFLF